MTHLGHEDQFPRPSLSGRCRLGEATFAAMGRKEEDAPLADMPCKREPHARGADREWHGIDHPFYVL
jgi:hypothetical protein